MTIDWEIDPAKAVQAGGILPRLTGPATRILERMRLDLEIHQPQRGRLVGEVHADDTTETHYAHGVRGSGVADDVRVLSGVNCSNQAVADAVDDLIAGRARLTKLHIGALAAVEGYADGRFKGLTVPEDALEDPPSQVDEDDGFADFAEAVDELVVAEEVTAERTTRERERRDAVARRRRTWEMPPEWMAVGSGRDDALRAAFERRGSC